MGLERIKEFKVKGNPYSMQFPTVGQFLDIEAKRLIYSNNTYSQMLMSPLKSSNKAMDIIDMAATLSVLCPALVKDLKCPTLLDLDIFDSKELMDVWNDELKSWSEEWMKLFVSSASDDTEKPKKVDTSEE